MKVLEEYEKKSYLGWNNKIWNIWAGERLEYEAGYYLPRNDKQGKNKKIDVFESHIEAIKVINTHEELISEIPGLIKGNVFILPLNPKFKSMSIRPIPSQLLIVNNQKCLLIDCSLDLRMIWLHICGHI
jgi:hypothetical protein